MYICGVRPGVRQKKQESGNAMFYEIFSPAVIFSQVFLSFSLFFFGFLVFSQVFSVFVCFLSFSYFLFCFLIFSWLSKNGLGAQAALDVPAYV